MSRERFRPLLLSCAGWKTTNENRKERNVGFTPIRACDNVFFSDLFSKLLAFGWIDRETDISNKMTKS